MPLALFVHWLFRRPVLDYKRPRDIMPPSTASPVVCGDSPSLPKIGMFYHLSQIREARVPDNAPQPATGARADAASPFLLGRSQQLLLPSGHRTRWPDVLPAHLSTRGALLFHHGRALRS